MNVHKTFRRRPIRLFERFQYFSFETKIQKNAGSFFLKKNWNTVFQLKVLPFPFKTALSEGNVKTNRIGSAKWIYHKERRLARNYFMFSKILFHFKNLV